MAAWEEQLTILTAKGPPKKKVKAPVGAPVADAGGPKPECSTGLRCPCRGPVSSVGGILGPLTNGVPPVPENGPSLNFGVKMDRSEFHCCQNGPRQGGLAKMDRTVHFGNYEFLAVHCEFFVDFCPQKAPNRVGAKFAASPYE